MASCEDGQSCSGTEIEAQPATDAEGGCSEAELLGSKRPLQRTISNSSLGQVCFHKKHIVARLAGVIGAAILICSFVMRFKQRPSTHTAHLGYVTMESEVLTGNTAATEDALCRQDEEYFNYLCYRKCSELTHGSHPIRTSAVTCCKAHPCGFFNQKHSLGFCGGFSVAGGERKTCPHTPGDCLETEEFFVGQCYKKCSLLTDKKFPHRVAPGTCCKTKSTFWCTVSGSSSARSSPAFDLGGGSGLQAIVHGPLRSRVRPGIGPLALSPVSTSTTTAPFTTAPITTPSLPKWYADAVRGQEWRDGSTSAQEEPANGVPSWAQDILPDAGLASEEQHVSRHKTQRPKQPPKEAAAAANAPAWMKESLDDPMMAGTIAAGQAEESPAASGDLGRSTPKTAPRREPVPAPAPSPRTISTQQPTPAPAGRAEESATRSGDLTKTAPRPVPAPTSPPGTTSRPQPTPALAGRAGESPMDSGDLLGGSAPRATPVPAPAPSPGITSRQQPTPAPVSEPPPPVRKNGRNATKGSKSDTGAGNSKPPPPVPDWAQDYVAGS